MKKSVILICDDDYDIVQAVKVYLRQAGFSVRAAYNGIEALEILRTEPIDLVILDLMMPILSGVETLKMMRQENWAPVIILSAKGEEKDKVEALQVGADDYLTKPFQAGELVARVQSQLRRYMQYEKKEEKDHVLRHGNLELYPREHRLIVEGEEVLLTAIEFQILHFLMKHAGETFSSEAIYEAVWKEDSNGNASTVAVHIRHLREKIEINPKDPRYIRVIWGVGYVFMKRGEVR